MRKNTIIVILLVLLCSSFISLGIVIANNQPTALRNNDTGKTNVETNEETNDTVQEIPIDDDYIYNWLLKNGELKNGTELIYNRELSDVCSYSIYTDTDKCIEFTYTTNELVLYSISLSMDLFSPNKASFSCEIIDRTETGVCTDYIHYRTSFTRNSPIESKGIAGHILDGDYLTSIDIIDGKRYRTYYKSGEGIVYEEISSDKIQTWKTEKEILSNEVAQKLLCAAIETLNNDFCPLVGIDIIDLGYENYK